MWMPSTFAKAPSAVAKGPSIASAAATASGPSSGTKYDEYSGNTTSLAPRWTASVARFLTATRLASASLPGANCATATGSFWSRCGIPKAYGAPRCITKEDPESRGFRALTRTAFWWVVPEIAEVTANKGRFRLRDAFFQAKAEEVPALFANARGGTSRIPLPYWVGPSTTFGNKP